MGNCSTKTSDQFNVNPTQNIENDFKESRKGVQLIYAIRMKSVSRVQKAIRQSADVNYQTQRKWTPLHHAVLSNSGDLRIIELLVRNGSDVNAKEHSGQTPLALACSNNKPAAVSFLLQNGAEVNARDRRRNSALHWAILGGATDCIKLLLNWGADVNALNVKNRRPVHYAVYKSDFETVALLLARGAIVGEMHDNILHMAVANRRLDLVLILLHHGVDVNTQDSRGYSPLHSAVFARNVQIVQLLLQRGADVNLTNKLQQTAVQYSMEQGSLFVTETILRHLVRLKSLGLFISKTNLACLKAGWNPRLTKFETECKNEVALMSEQLVSSEHCYCVRDLLTKDERQMVKFLGNGGVRQRLRVTDFESRYTNYCRLIVNRVAAIAKKAEVIARSADVLRSIFNVKVPDVCVDKIGSFLTEKERLKLIETETNQNFELVIVTPNDC